jgi:hypothetical protein
MFYGSAAAPGIPKTLDKVNHMFFSTSVNPLALAIVHHVLEKDLKERTTFCEVLLKISFVC